jgi:CDP-paratose 2-epimerase
VFERSESQKQRTYPKNGTVAGMVKTALVTGSCGLIGSEVSLLLAQNGFDIFGIDNNSRATFFGKEASTRQSLSRLHTSIPGYQHFNLDVRERLHMAKLVAEIRPDVIVHTAAQPSHDRSAAIPFDDWDTNATGTFNLLEAVHRWCPGSTFVFLSSNKVYGDRPNNISRYEHVTRWDFSDTAFLNGISESFPIDASTHSPFGASKLSADILVQEYGRYYGMATCCLRCGCLTGPNHAGVELHGFLNYLIGCNVEEREYRIFGYGGKQVRDNLHAFDVASFVLAFTQAPRVAEVYNLGGGRENACSILEAFTMAEEATGKPQRYSYVAEPRRGDHVVYYSDLLKARLHYPGWRVTKSLPVIFQEIADSFRK